MVDISVVNSDLLTFAMLVWDQSVWGWIFKSGFTAREETWPSNVIKLHGWGNGVAGGDQSQDGGRMCRKD